ncbi:hypothetical protein OPV22_018636 [Ensete ventricosum]|uniref:Uncharacterized protein n=1 Tax=Ensete ventricosum TaxID=4639 RepID=A0AAV8QW26_ENSVE|nr:hypothetical protein OPV22_018636 [Ensete ventricosum]
MRATVVHWHGWPRAHGKHHPFPCTVYPAQSGVRKAVKGAILGFRRWGTQTKDLFLLRRTVKVRLQEDSSSSSSSLQAVDTESAQAYGIQRAVMMNPISSWNLRDGVWPPPHLWQSLSHLCPS